MHIYLCIYKYRYTYTYNRYIEISYLYVDLFIHATLMKISLFSQVSYFYHYALFGVIFT